MTGKMFPLLKRLFLTVFYWVACSTLVGWIGVNLFYREHGAIAVVLIATFLGFILGLVHALIISIRSKATNDPKGRSE